MQGQGEIVVLTPLFRSVIITILFALALVFYVSSDISFGQLFTPLPLLLVAIPLAAAHLALSLMCRVLHWSSVYLSLGVPLGLIACCVGITGMAANLQDPRELEAAMSFSFMCVLYGGVFSALGYFAVKESPEVQTQVDLSLRAYLLFMIVFTGTVLFAMTGAAGIGEFISYEALFVFCSVFAVQISLRSKISPQKLSESVLLASILCLVLTLIIWYRIGGINREAISIATVGIVYGLVSHVIIYVSAHLRNQDRKMDVGRANWHWLEVSAFMIFMLFAPETIREHLVNERESKQEKLTKQQYEDRKRSVQS